MLASLGATAAIVENLFKTYDHYSQCPKTPVHQFSFKLDHPLTSWISCENPNSRTTTYNQPLLICILKIIWQSIFEETIWNQLWMDKQREGQIDGHSHYYRLPKLHVFKSEFIERFFTTDKWYFLSLKIRTRRISCFSVEINY